MAVILLAALVVVIVVHRLPLRWFARLRVGPLLWLAVIVAMGLALYGELAAPPPPSEDGLEGLPRNLSDGEWGPLEREAAEVLESENLLRAARATEAGNRAGNKEDDGQSDVVALPEPEPPVRVARPTPAHPPTRERTLAQKK